MGIFKKIKAAMAARELVEGVWRDRRGWKTPQFWLAALGSAGSLLAALAGILDPVVAAVAAAVIAGLYAIVRGIQKAEQDGTTKWWTSTEWQLGALTALSGTLIAVQQAGVDAQWVVTANAVLVALLAHAQHKDLSDPAQPGSTEQKENDVNKIKGLILLAGLALGLAAPARAVNLTAETAFGTFIAPLSVVNGTELYSFKEGKGFPAAETVLWEKEKWQVTAGAAAVIGTDVNVPFLGVQTRLSTTFFDTSGNELRFGAWVGKPSQRLDEDRKARWLWGVKASVPLW